MDNNINDNELKRKLDKYFSALGDDQLSDDENRKIAENIIRADSSLVNEKSSRAGIIEIIIRLFSPKGNNAVGILRPAIALLTVFALATLLYFLLFNQNRTPDHKPELRRTIAGLDSGEVKNETAVAVSKNDTAFTELDFMPLQLQSRSLNGEKSNRSANQDELLRTAFKISAKLLKNNGIIIDELTTGKIITEWYRDGDNKTRMIIDNSSTDKSGLSFRTETSGLKDEEIDKYSVLKDRKFQDIIIQIKKGYFSWFEEHRSQKR